MYYSPIPHFFAFKLNFFEIHSKHFPQISLFFLFPIFLHMLSLTPMDCWLLPCLSFCSVLTYVPLWVKHCCTRCWRYKPSRAFSLPLVFWDQEESGRPNMQLRRWSVCYNGGRKRGVQFCLGKQKTIRDSAYVPFQIENGWVFIKYLNPWFTAIFKNKLIGHH